MTIFLLLVSGINFFFCDICIFASLYCMNLLMVLFCFLSIVFIRLFGIVSFKVVVEWICEFVEDNFRGFILFMVLRRGLFVFSLFLFSKVVWVNILLVVLFFLFLELWKFSLFNLELESFAELKVFKFELLFDSFCWDWRFEYEMLLFKVCFGFFWILAVMTVYVVWICLRFLVMLIIFFFGIVLVFFWFICILALVWSFMYLMVTLFLLIINFVVELGIIIFICFVRFRSYVIVGFSFIVCGFCLIFFIIKFNILLIVLIFFIISLIFFCVLG